MAFNRKTRNIVFYVILIIFPVAGFVAGCQKGGGESKVVSQKETATASKYNIEKDIPVNKQGKLSYMYSYTREYLAKCSLLELEKGYDSLAIRLWFHYSFDRRIQIVELKKKNKQWNAEFILLTENYDKNDSLISVSQEIIYNKKPASGWDSFMRELLLLNITTLPCDADIPEYNSPMDGAGVCVEIATIEKYRFYDYSSPSYNVENIWQAKNMVLIMELIEGEFDFKRIRKI
jgi:hypothetical protein